ncbi:MAG: efflux RND transporter periplasmic adaptor subunit [Desulfuromonadales bacterium]|nr:efflux RND transporter periplasmic adaptor subunit [Desulfuromonadales bacterium]
MNRVTLFICLLLFLQGCNEKIEPGRVSEADEKQLPVTLLTLQPSLMGTEEEFVGTVESRDRAVLTARSSGLVARLEVREGARVSEGQLLLEISDNSAAERLRAADAAVRVAERHTATARVNLTLAGQTEERYRQLLAAEAVTPQEYDQIKAERDRSRQQLAAAEAELARGQAERDIVRRNNSHNQVTAPFSGQVVTLQVKQGSTASPGTPLLVIDREGARQARIKLPERLLGEMAIGTSLTLHVPALQRDFTGEISQIQGGSDPATRSFDLIVDLPAANDLPTGLFVRARRPLPAEELLLIPETAIAMRGQLTGVFQEQQGKLSFRLVRLGRRFGDQLEVLSGLKAGDRVVKEEVARELDGARVENLP